MHLNQTELDWLLDEAAPLLEECAVQKVFETGASTRVLQLRRPGQTLLLLVCADPETARAHLTPTRGQQPPSPSALTMLMRKWIQGMVVREVERYPGDRVFVLRGDRVNPAWERGADGAAPPRVDVALVIELTGRLSNLLVLGPRGEVLGMEHPDPIQQRGLRPGHRWVAPPPPPDDRELSNRWADDALPSPGDAEIPGAPRNAHAARWFDEHLEAWHLAREVRALRGDLKRQHKKLRRLVKNIEGDLDRAEQAQRWRKFGELLQSAYGKVERGASEVRVPDYYQEGMPEVAISLDPKLSLQENIDHYFKQYRRLHGAIDLIEERLLDAMEQRDRLEQARQQVDARATSREALRRWRGDLQAEGLLPRPRPRGRDRRKQREAARAPYRAFRSRKGAAILVGRDAKSNDHLSTHVARGRDVWLHARDWAGSHVILRQQRGSDTIDQGDLLDAATLAAHFSQGRRDTLVDVTYTRAKHVRKPKGYPPGRVTVASGSTLAVAIEPARLEQLLASEER